MFHGKSSGISIFMFVILCTAGAMADVPDLVNSFATTAAGPGVQVSVFTRPNGTGFPLTSARVFGSPNPTIVDATIEVTLLDASGIPVVAHPREDIWLETSLDGLILCPDGSIADAPTDFFGRTTFSGPIYGGGATDPVALEKTLVMVGGAPLNGSDLDIQFNSADMSPPTVPADGIVNLLDLAIFSQAFFGTYKYAADFYWNGVINLSDIALFSQSWLASCPSP